MNRVIIYILLSFVCFSSSTAQDLIIATYDPATVYRGIPNPLRISSESLKGKVELYASNGTLKKEKKKWYWTPSRNGPTAIYLIKAKKKDTVYVDSVLFRVGEMNVPRIYFDRIRSSHSFYPDWNKATRLVFDTERFAHIELKKYVTVISYNIEIKFKNYTKVFTAEGPNIPEEFTRALKRMPRGTSIRIYNLKLKCSWFEEPIIYDGFYANLNAQRLEWSLF